MDESPAPQAEPSPRRPVFGRAGEGASIQLVRKDGDHSDPFVVLHSGRFAQILLAECQFEHFGVKRRFAVKLQSSDYASEADSQLTNLDVEAMWRQEAADLLRVESPNIVRSLLHEPEPLQTLPVAFCRRTDSWFHPPCPETGTPLTVCRDDDLLRSCGLPAFSRSLVRYLFAPEAHAGQRPRVFYRASGVAQESPRQGVEVRIGGRLWRDYQAALAKDRLPAGSLPCQTCEHRTTCFPSEVASDQSIPAEQALYSVAFYDSLMLPVELLDLPFDDYCDWLGGKDLHQSEAGSGTPTTEAPGERAAALPKSRDRQAWLFAGDPQRWWAEVLQLKLDAFAEICAGLRDIHLHCGRPHLGLSPGNVMAERLPNGETLPPRWHSRVRLIDLGSACAKDVRTGEGVTPRQRLLQPASELRGTMFEHKRLSEQDRLSARLWLHVDRREEEGDQFRIAISAEPGALNVRSFRAGDVIEAHPTNGAREFWLEVVEVRPARIVAAARLPGDHPVARLSAGSRMEASCTFRKLFGPASDLFGLGMLLFRMLLVNDATDLFRVQETVEQSLGRIAAETHGPRDEAAFERMVRGIIHAHGPIFAAEALFFRQQDRTQRHQPLDSALWQELLLFAFRLVTWIPGASFATDHSDTHSHKRGALLDQVMAQVAGFRQRTTAELFRPERASEILAACQETKLAAESDLIDTVRGQTTTDQQEPSTTGQHPKTTPSTAIPQPAATGIRLTITLDRQQILSRTYPQEQLTIGRRKDNTVVLDQEIVSNRHARIERGVGGCSITDLKSRNGTYLNGRYLPADVPEELRSNDEILIGPYRIEFEDLSDLSRTITVAAQAPSRPLFEDLIRGYARVVDGSPDERRNHLAALLAERLGGKSPKLRLIALEEVETRLTPYAPKDSRGAGDDPRVDPELATKALLLLEGLADRFHLDLKFSSRKDLEQFGAGLTKFLQGTFDYIWKTEQILDGVCNQLEVDVTSMLRRKRGPLGGVSEASMLPPVLLGDVSTTTANAAANLEHLLTNFTAMQIGLVKGCQDMISTILDAMSPERLEKEASKAAPATIFGDPTSKAAQSQLWKTFRAIHARFSEPGHWERDVVEKLRDGVRKAHVQLTEPPKT